MRAGGMNYAVAFGYLCGVLEVLAAARPELAEDLLRAIERAEAMGRAEAAACAGGAS